MNIGILGHVDAGKTTLAKTLSTFGSTAAFDKGAKSSNLRANTIDLGFSALQIDESRKIALIDCPGHAQLTNAVLVASSVFDGSIVVISSVRGIEPQTAEHLILVSILCPEKVIIVLSKIDLVEPLKVELLKKKLPKLLKSLKIKEDSPIIPLDLSEEGKKESVNELIEVLRSFPVPDRVSSGKFVMAVDHCFPIKGKGSVMTGTVVDGSCKVGSEIEIPIIGEKRKVKEIQSWKKSVPEVKIGERAAILFGNLQKTENIDRILIFEPGGMTSGKPISSTSLVFAKKRKRPQKGKERPEVVEVDDDDDPDDVVDEKTALAARGILHMGIGEPEEVVDDGLPKDYKRRVLKLGSRRLDTLLNRTSGKSSAEVEKMILTGKVRVNEQVVKKKAYNVMKRDEVDVWIEELEENPNFANIHRVKIIDYVLKQHGYDIDSLIWQKMLVENWRRDQENLSGEN